MSQRTVVTGGAGYLGMLVVDELLGAGRAVVVLDSLLHDQQGHAQSLRDRGVRLVEGDIRDGEARASALEGAEAVVHLAAIVGDPACAQDPKVSEEVNVGASLALVADAKAAGARRLVFASTCSNYGRMADPTVPITEEGVLAPVSLYAAQKVGIERALLDGDHLPLRTTCLRLATVYGAGPRMRFDLTVNEFTRDLWSDRDLEVFGEQFWRPYVHVRDAARGVRTVLEADEQTVAGEVFNLGRSGENYRKLDIVEAIQRQTDRGRVQFVTREEDPRDYKVCFDKVASVLGFETLKTVPDGIAEVIAELEAGTWGDPWDRAYRNLP